MITTLRNKNIFEMDVEAIVNPVNCEGVMGRGLALEFKNMFPDNFKYYQEQCFAGHLKVGTVLVFNRNVHKIEVPKYIINFPTKDHWRNPSKIEYINEGLSDLKNKIISHDIKSIAIPMIGCGLGQLKWEDVNKLIREHLLDLEGRSIFVLEN